MPDLAVELLDSISLIRRHARRRSSRPWPMRSLSLAQAELVRVVRRQPGITVAGAATELGVAANTVSTLVGSLTTAGMLRRVADADHRRVVRLHLTDTARRQLDKARDERAEAVSAAVSGLETADRRALEAALPALARLAEQLRPEET